MMRTFLVISFLGFCTTSYAELLELTTFRIDIKDGWMYEIDSGDRKQIDIFHSDRNSTLKLMTINAPALVTADTLRNMTNVDLSAPLTWQQWGDYAGYQYDYAEGDSFFRQWWLARDAEVLLVVYTSNAISDDVEIDVINRMVNSISAK